MLKSVDFLDNFFFDLQNTSNFATDFFSFAADDGKLLYASCLTVHNKRPKKMRRGG